MFCTLSVCPPQTLSIFLFLAVSLCRLGSGSLSFDRAGWVRDEVQLRSLQSLNSSTLFPTSHLPLSLLFSSQHHFIPSPQTFSSIFFILISQHLNPHTLSPSQSSLLLISHSSPPSLTYTPLPSPLSSSLFPSLLSLSFSPLLFPLSRSLSGLDRVTVSCYNRTRLHTTDAMFSAWTGLAEL